MKYPHLSLVDWPFTVVPRMTGPPVWAGRTELRQKVDRLLRTVGRRSPSSLHLMWADFGAGKTHTLFYMNSAAKTCGMHPTYVEWPKKASTFVDVYRSIASRFSLRVLSTMFWDYADRAGVDHVLNWADEVYPDFQAILELIYRRENNPLINEWLRAERGISKRELATIGVRNTIRTSDDAIRALVILTGLVANGTDHSKLLLMLDEFQRIDQLAPRVRRDINAGIHTLFNACPEGLCIVLSFSFGNPANIEFLLAEEVASRTDPESIQLPRMTFVEAVNFVQDILKHYRALDGTDPFFPFTKDGIETILQKTGKLTPREIMKYLDLVLRNADEEIEAGTISMVTSGYALNVLDNATIPKDEDT